MSDLESDDNSEMSYSSDEEDILNHRTKNTNFLGMHYTFMFYEVINNLYIFFVDETVPNCDDCVFFEYFRVSLALQDSVHKFETIKFHKTQSGNFGKTTPSEQVIVTLWYMGHKRVSFRDEADRFNITVSSLFRIIRRVCHPRLLNG